MTSESFLKVALPPEVEPYRDDIRRFVDAMIYKLKVHSKKGKWETLDMASVLPKLQAEVAELEEAVAGGNMVEVLLEAADVANYALISASIAVEKGK